MPIPCINSTADTTYLNRADVRDALHIPEGVQNWTVCRCVQRCYVVVVILLLLF